MKNIIFIFCFFYTFNIYAFNKNCDFPDEIKLSYETKSSSVNINTDSDSKPRVYYNFPESNMGFVVEKLENPSNLDYNYKSVSTWIDSIIGEIFAQ